MRRKRSSVSRTSATTTHSSMSLSAANFRVSSRVGRAGRHGRSRRTGPYWPGASGPGAAAFTSPGHPCCARTPAAPPAQCAATVQAHDPPEHRLFPSRLSGLRRRGRRRAGCRAVAERSGRGGKGPRMRCWSKWPVGQSDPIGYWPGAAAVLEPEPLPTVVITTKGRWRIKGASSNRYRWRIRNELGALFQAPYRSTKILKDCR
jgi:hypothetical protein